MFTTTRRLAVFALSDRSSPRSPDRSPTNAVAHADADETPTPPPPSGFDEATQVRPGSTRSLDQSPARGLGLSLSGPTDLGDRSDRAQVMAANDVMSHRAQRPEGLRPARRCGHPFATAGEIIAEQLPDGALSVAESIHAWLNSPSHRAIMLSTGYNYVGWALESAMAAHYGGVRHERDETGVGPLP